MKKLFNTKVLSTLLFLSVSILPVNSEPLSQRMIKVGMSQNLEAIPVSTSGKGAIYLFKNDKMNKIIDIDPQQYCLITYKKNIVELSTKNKTYNLTGGRIFVRNTDEDSKYANLVFGGSHWYRGYLEIFPSMKYAKYLALVNVLPVEEYLYGVVPSEMPASWPLEALKTQAIAARTYVLGHLGQFASEGFDILPTTASQVYGGVEEETPVTNQAVNETRGKVVTYNSKLISAFYSSGAGGMTESGMDAWGSYIPYLKSVRDFDQDSPRYVWYKNISNEEIQKILKKDYATDLGNVTRIFVAESTNSGRVKTILFEGTKNSITIDAKKWRLSAKLSSTLFKVEPVDPGTMIVNENDHIPTLFLFSGRGFGHGSGMSQWGARFLAKTGRSSEDILKYYYQGVKIIDVDKL